MASSLKRILIGKPLASADEHAHRLSKTVALPVFSSDAISSTAYATEEILRVLLVGAGAQGLAAYTKLVPISLIVVVLLAIVVTSYRQTIFAYPSGGGSYVVSRENLGEMPSLIAGSSLLTDYILTVAVSVAGGVAAIISAFPGLADYRVPMCIGFIMLMTVANLRGLKESGALFAPPTYVYIVSLVVLIVVGLYKIFFKDLGPIPQTGAGEELLQGTGDISMFLFLQAFASGAVALSGVEAVSNGVPAFKKPEPRNASITLMWMAAILGSCFFGLAVISQHLKPVAGEGVNQTVLAQLAEQIYGGRNLAFFITQFATFAILILAANTAYADYPRLSSIIAKDGYMPRQFANRGDRLVFSNGIVFLAVMAIALIVDLRRQDRSAHPALCGGRVHRLHTQPDGHVCTPREDQRTTMEARFRDQRCRRVHNRGRRDRRRGHQVRQGRLGQRARHPGAHHSVQSGPPPLRPRAPGGCRRTRLPRAASPAPRRRPRRLDQQGRAPRDSVRRAASLRTA